MKNKILIAGCGSIAKTHAKNLQGKADLLFWSRSSEKSKAYASEYSGKAIETDFESLVSDSAIDAIVLCTPPELHLQQSLQCLRAKKPALVEKPLCISPTELAQIEQEYLNSKSIFMVAENYYYKPCFAHLKKMLGSSLLGDLRRVHLQKCTQQVARSWKSNYGALLEGGIHFVAFLNGLVEKPLLKLKAEIPPSEILERSSSLFLEYEGNIQARLEYAWNRPALFKGLFQHSVIEGSTGQLTFESNGLYLLYRSYKMSVPAFIPFLKDIAGYQAMMENFLSALQGKQEIYSSFEKAKRDLQIVFDAYDLNTRNSVGKMGTG